MSEDYTDGYVPSGYNAPNRNLDVAVDAYHIAKLVWGFIDVLVWFVVGVLCVCAVSGCVIGSNNVLNAQALTSRSAIPQTDGQSNFVESASGMEGGATLTPNTQVIPLP